MPLICRSAYLWICGSCRKHGFIAFSNDLATQSFCSKESARLQLEMSYEQNVITKEEVLAVRDQISNSPLPESDNEVDIVTLIKMMCDNFLLDYKWGEMPAVEKEVVH